MTKNKSTLVIYLVTGLSAVLAVSLVYLYTNSRIADARQAMKKEALAQVASVAPTRVVVAARDLAAGAVFAAADLKVAEVSHDLVQDMAVISDPATIIGKKTSQALYAGEWILAPRLEGADSRSDFSRVLENGRRAIRVTVTASSGLLGLIAPADRVDVIGIFPLDSNGQGSRTILQNVPVLAVGSHPESTGKKEGEAVKGEPDSAAAAVTVALDVSTTEAEKLALATQAGKIHLVLRNRTDQKQEDSSLIQLASLANVPRQAGVVGKSLAPEQSVTVIRGDKIETEIIKK